MKIVRLESQNVKRLKAVTIKPDGNLVVIGGNNGHGKSSTIDSIAYALGGKNAICDEPINRGAEKAKIICDLGDIVVTRTFTKAGGGQLVVANKDGARYQSPQAMLDAMVGRLSFDPLEFATMDGRRRLETLKNLVGLDFTHLDTKRKQAFDDRTAVNREIKNLKSRLDAMPTEDPDAKPVSVSELMAEMRRRQEVNAKNNDVRWAYQDAKGHVESCNTGIAELETKLKALKKEKSDAEKLLGQYKAKVEKLHDEDVAKIEAQIELAEEVNNKVRQNEQRKKASESLQIAENTAANFTQTLSDIDKEKADALASAEFPVDGLSFDENGVTYNGIPFDQASDAEKLRVSVAMGIAMNPKLKVLLIRNGSLLDEDNLKMVAELAADNDAQVWMERVGKGKECSVIIENGEVSNV